MDKLKTLLKQREELNKQIAVEESKNIKWTKIGDLEWSEDLGEMNWKDAKKKCKELGGRLPKRFELVRLYDEFNKEVKDWSAYYWSATEYSETYARYVGFTDGSTDDGNKTNANSVRCVRGCKL